MNSKNQRIIGYLIVIAGILALTVPKLRSQTTGQRSGRALSAQLQHFFWRHAQRG